VVAGTDGMFVAIGASEVPGTRSGAGRQRRGRLIRPAPASLSVRNPGSPESTGPPLVDVNLQSHSYTRWSIITVRACMCGAHRSGREFGQIMGLIEPNAALGGG
jgi:hypothetical protein